MWSSAASLSPFVLRTVVRCEAVRDREGSSGTQRMIIARWIVQGGRRAGDPRTGPDIDEGWRSRSEEWSLLRARGVARSPLAQGLEDRS